MATTPARPTARKNQPEHADVHTGVVEVHRNDPDGGVDPNFQSSRRRCCPADERRAQVGDRATVGRDGGWAGNRCDRQPRRAGGGGYDDQHARRRRRPVRTGRSPRPGELSAGNRSSSRSLSLATSPFGRPGGRECARVGCAVTEHFFRRDSVRLGLLEIGLELGRHLVCDRIRDAESFPFTAALVDELGHVAASAWTRPSTASTASRVARHSETPVRQRPLPLDGRTVVLARWPAVARGTINLPPALRAPDGRAADRSSLRRQSRARGRGAAPSSRSRRPAPPPSPPEGRGPAPRGGIGCGGPRQLPCATS